MDIRLRKRSECDSAFLFQLFSQIKKVELHFDLFPEEISSRILQMQYNAWEEMVRTRYSGSDDFIIMFDSERVGRVQFSETAEELRIINISILPLFQGEGIGTEILRKLLTDATRKKLQATLEVDKSNPAINLYRRLGFTEYQDGQLKTLMKYPTSCI